jgi:hypothetical protein
VVPVSLANGEVAKCRGFTSKRLKGFEPSTFCMATTPAAGGVRAITVRFTGDFCAARQAPRAVDRRRCAPICGVSGTSGLKFPKLSRAVQTLSGGSTLPGREDPRPIPAAEPKDPDIGGRSAHPTSGTSFRSAEVAEMLETTEVSVNSALQRARKAPERAGRGTLPTSPTQRALLERFAEAFQGRRRRCGGRADRGQQTAGLRLLRSRRAGGVSEVRWHPRALVAGIGDQLADQVRGHGDPLVLRLLRRVLPAD